MAKISDTKVNVKERLAQLVKGASTEFKHPSSPKIQKVPGFLRENEDFIKYCFPKVISFGPIHYKDKNLEQGRRYKAQWTSLYIKEYSKQITRSIEVAAESLHRTIENHILDLKKLFSEDVIKNYENEELTWMLFEDGCSLLYYMTNVDRRRPQNLGMKLDQLLYTWRDIIMLENQLPMKVLELLSGKKGVELVMLVYNFQTLGIAKQNRLYKMALRDNAIHILDFCRSAYVAVEEDIMNIQNRNNEHNDQMALQTYKNIRDLKTAGIRMKASKIDNWSLRAVKFSSGWFGAQLKLPEFRFNDIMPCFFTNMIAYEMCPDFINNLEFCSYFTFMKSLIDDAADVKELRIAGVLKNSLYNDEELAEFFNKIGKELPTNLLFNNPQFDRVVYNRQYSALTHQIHTHYTNKWKTWLAETKNTYFSVPSSFIAFLAACAVLILTFIQTLYSAQPKS